MQQVGLREAIRTYMARERLSQSELANRVGISQSTVSRALKQDRLRSSQADSRLFSFMQQAGMIGRPPAAVEQLVLSAFEGVWDRTEEHANAVAKIIKATEGLRPVKKGETA